LKSREKFLAFRGSVDSRAWPIAALVSKGTDVARFHRRERFVGVLLAHRVKRSPPP
jgi:hypothetical protein